MPALTNVEKKSIHHLLNDTIPEWVEELRHEGIKVEFDFSEFDWEKFCFQERSDDNAAIIEKLEEKSISGPLYQFVYRLKSYKAKFPNDSKKWNNLTFKFFSIGIDESPASRSSEDAKVWWFAIQPGHVAPTVFDFHSTMTNAGVLGPGDTFSGKSVEEVRKQQNRNVENRPSKKPCCPCCTTCCEKCTIL